MSETGENEIWVKDLLMSEVTTRYSKRGQRILVPNSYACSKYGKIRGYVGRFSGTFKNGYGTPLSQVWGKWIVKFYPDRKTFFDRNYNGHLDDEGFLFAGIVLSRATGNPVALAIPVASYANSTRKAGTFRFYE